MAISLGRLPLGSQHLENKTEPDALGAAVLTEDGGVRAARRCPRRDAVTPARESRGTPASPGPGPQPLLSGKRHIPYFHVLILAEFKLKTTLNIQQKSLIFHFQVRLL